MLYEVGVEKDLFEKTDLESVVENTIAENFDPLVSQQCSEVILNYDRVWKMGDMTRRVTDAISLTEKNLERAIKQKISFQWLHEDVLGPCSMTLVVPEIFAEWYHIIRYGRCRRFYILYDPDYTHSVVIRSHLKRMTVACLMILQIH